MRRPRASARRISPASPVDRSTSAWHGETHWAAEYRRPVTRYQSGGIMKKRPFSDGHSLGARGGPRQVNRAGGGQAPHALNSLRHGPRTPASSSASRIGTSRKRTAVGWKISAAGSRSSSSRAPGDSGRPGALAADSRGAAGRYGATASPPSASPAPRRRRRSGRAACRASSGPTPGGSPTGRASWPGCWPGCAF